MDTKMIFDERGLPRLQLVDVPASAAPKSPSKVPSDGVSDDELSRRRDAVREAAREFETLDDQDIRERLRGVTNRALSEDEVSQFTADVRQHQLDDLVDVLDQRTRGKRRGRRTVRLQAPRGYVRKTLNALTDDERAGMTARLRARGWSQAEVTDLALKHLKGKLPGTSRS